MTAYVDPPRFRDAMAITASGITIVTTDGPAGRAGITISTLCSLSLEPPSVIICVNRDSVSLAQLVQNGVFAANVLSCVHAPLADVFAGRTAHERENRFAEGRWHELRTGSPVLEDALCAFDCRIAEIFDFGSHRIVAGVVVEIEQSAQAPLVHSNRAYRRLQAT